MFQTPSNVRGILIAKCQHKIKINIIGSILLSQDFCEEKGQTIPGEPCRSSWLLLFHWCFFQCKLYPESLELLSEFPWIVMMWYHHSKLSPPIKNTQINKEKAMPQCRNAVLHSKPVPHVPAKAVPVWMFLSCIKKILNRLSLLTGPFNRYSAYVWKCYVL